jgi:RNA polymerase sigma factor (sigma-70 family)
MSETASSKDRELLDRIQSGDREALVSIYKGHYSMIRSYVIKNQGRDEDAEDLLQDALIVLWQKVQQGNFVLSSKLSTYIMAICKNLWLKRLGKLQRMDGEDKILPHLHICADNFSEVSDFKHLQKALDEIGDTCRQLLMLFYFDGHDMEQIARKMDFANADTAKAKKYQCFKKLENLIKSRFSKSDFIS